MIDVKRLSLVFSLLLCCFVLDLVRREKLTFKYASGWIFLTLLGAFFAVFDVWIYRIASWLGFTLASNFVFFAVLLGFVLWSLVLTIFLCQQNKRNDRMAQTIGLLESELDSLKRKSHSSDKDTL
jgi:hypothetical protein